MWAKIVQTCFRQSRKRQGFTLIEVVFSSLLVAGIFFAAASLLIMGNNSFHHNRNILSSHEQARSLELLLYDNLATAKDILLSSDLIAEIPQQASTSFFFNPEEDSSGMLVYHNGQLLLTLPAISSLSIRGDNIGARSVLHYAIIAKHEDEPPYELKGSVQLNNFTQLPKGISTTAYTLGQNDYLNIISDLP